MGEAIRAEERAALDNAEHEETAAFPAKIVRSAPNSAPTSQEWGLWPRKSTA